MDVVDDDDDIINIPSFLPAAAAALPRPALPFLGLRISVHHQAQLLL